ncbi:MAG TPA: PAS domain S-box protein [Chitinophagales bacterium]|nr:PAS domain S-box protein [Chitinophagales bacterium]
MQFKNSDVNTRFPAAGGELEKLMREKDWSKTSLGSQDLWPQSLHTTLSIVLHSKFPMFLFWGEELICFYNESFRFILEREGKPPFVPGMQGEAAWGEMWHIIQPLTKQVLAHGEAIFTEDQLIPVIRNGKQEDSYWIFSFSPVYDESERPAGVIVTCYETTDKVITHRELEASRNDLEFAIEASGLGTWDYDPLKNNFTSNKRLKEWLGLAPDEPIDLTHFLDRIVDSDRQRVKDAIQKALEPSSGGSYDISYTIVHPFSKKETIVHAKGRTWFNTQAMAFRFNGTLEDITEKAIAAKKNEENEKLYHQLIYSSPSAIGILYGEDLVITIANDAIIGIWGKGKAIIGKPYFEALPELVTQGYKDIFAEVYRTGKPFNALETPVSILQNGSMELKYYNFLLQALRNIAGEINGIGIIATEVTSQALLNKKIREGEQRFLAAVQAVEGIVWTNNEKGEMEGEQPGWAALTGQQYHEYQGYGWAKAVHPDDAQPTIDAWRQALKEVKVFNFEHRVKTKDGNWRAFAVKATPLKNKDGSVREWVGVHTDVNKQKAFAVELEKQVQERTRELIQSNESLRKSEERYHLMVEEVQDYAILYLNREGIIENWNTGAEKIKGYKANEIIGLSFSNFYTDTDKKSNLPQKLLAQAAESGRAVQEGWRVRKDGSLFWASVVITAVHNEKREVIGFSKVTHDLTQKKNADDKLKQNSLQLEQKNIDLEKMNKELQSFAYISSHDLQEPLRKIQTFAMRLLEKESMNLSDNGKDLFKRMQGAALRMQTLIDDLLSYSRTTTSERKYEKTWLGKVVEQVKSDMKEELQQKNATIEATELCEVNIIPFQFRQLLHNLIGNSLKFSHPGSPPHITIKTRKAKGKEFQIENLDDEAMYCHISIADNGIGFEQHFSERIFEVFQRLHGRQDYQGTGIGLAIVKKIVENHEGIITASSELNKGATFDIYIPVS